jgi:F-box/TPR repeat protein Pof3
MLQGMHEKLVAKRAPAKAVDPLLALPLELAEMVLCHLTFKNVMSV